MWRENAVQILFKKCSPSGIVAGLAWKLLKFRGSN